MASMRPLTGASLPRRPPAAAARRLDPEHVAGLQRARGFRGQLFAVEQVATACAVLSARLAGRSDRAPLGEKRHAAPLERLQLANDAVPAAVLAVPAGSESEL